MIFLLSVHMLSWQLELMEFTCLEELLLSKLKEQKIMFSVKLINQIILVLMANEIILTRYINTYVTCYRGRMLPPKGMMVTVTLISISYSVWFVSSSGTANDLYILKGDGMSADLARKQADCKPTFVNFILLHGIFMVLSLGILLAVGSFYCQILPPQGSHVVQTPQILPG